MHWHTCLMGKPLKPKKDKPTPAQLLLAANLRALIESHETLNSPPKLAEVAGVDATMINRILRCDNAANIRTLEAIANALGVPVWRLHVPNDLNELAAWTIRALQASPPATPTIPPTEGGASKKLRTTRWIANQKSKAA